MKTITKKNVLKLAAAAFVFLFAANVVNAQTYPATIEGVYSVEDEIIYQTVGYGLTLYVAPDPFYSPDYDGSNPVGINPASLWRWVYGGSWNAGEEIKGWANQNFVELASEDLPEIGVPMIFWVKESFGAAGCADGGDGESKEIMVVGTPEITEFEGANTGDWEGEDDNFTFCGPNTATLLVTIDEPSVPESLREYSYEISVVRRYFDGADWNEDNSYDNDISIIGRQGFDHSVITTLLGYYNDGDDDFSTEYLFTLAENSLTSKISTVSAYRANPIADAPSYIVPVNTIRYVVALPPTTGPIYHIPNDFNQF